MTVPQSNCSLFVGRITPISLSSVHWFGRANTSCLQHSRSVFWDEPLSGSLEGVVVLVAQKRRVHVFYVLRHVLAGYLNSFSGGSVVYLTSVWHLLTSLVAGRVVSHQELYSSNAHVSDKVSC